MRTDYLMYLLLGVVDQDFRVSYFKIKNGIQPIVLSENDKRRKAKAMAISAERALELITEMMEEQKVYFLYFSSGRGCIQRNHFKPISLTFSSW